MAKLIIIPNKTIIPSSIVSKPVSGICYNPDKYWSLISDIDKNFYREEIGRYPHRCAPLGVFSDGSVDTKVIVAHATSNHKSFFKYDNITRKHVQARDFIGYSHEGGGYVKLTTMTVNQFFQVIDSPNEVSRMNKPYFWQPFFEIFLELKNNELLVGSYSNKENNELLVGSYSNKENNELLVGAYSNNKITYKISFKNLYEINPQIFDFSLHDEGPDSIRATVSGLKPLPVAPVKVEGSVVLAELINIEHVLINSKLVYRYYYKNDGKIICLESEVPLVNVSKDIVLDKNDSALLNEKFSYDNKDLFKFKTPELEAPNLRVPKGGLIKDKSELPWPTKGEME